MKWTKGMASPNPAGRAKGKSQQVRLREAREKAIDTLISAAHRGDPAACAAIIQCKDYITTRGE